MDKRKKKEKKKRKEKTQPLGNPRERSLVRYKREKLLKNRREI